MKDAQGAFDALFNSTLFNSYPSRFGRGGEPKRDGVGLLPPPVRAVDERQDLRDGFK